MFADKMFAEHLRNILTGDNFFAKIKNGEEKNFDFCRYRLMVRTPRFQCGNRGSIPLSGTRMFACGGYFLYNGK